MTTPPGRRAGMAIVRIEHEEGDPTRVLLRVTAVADLTQRDPLPEGAPFADVEGALAYLRDWLEQWLRGR